MERAEGPEHIEVIARAALEEGVFLRLTLSQPRGAEAAPWARITVRPVAIQGRYHLQFSYFDGKKDTVQNHAGEALRAELDRVLALPFGRIHAQTTAEDIHVQVTRQGKVLLKRAKPSRREPPDLAHDHAKARPLPSGARDEFLQAIGLADAQGRIRPSMGAKYRQVNQFLGVIEQVVGEGALAQRPLAQGPLRLLDCGCGSAYLTFAAYHHLNHTLGREAHLVGVDVNPATTAPLRELADRLGWAEISFRVSTIAALELDEPPDLVLSLHACDTATDEAIARGILWGSPAILAAPCCQHELHHQLREPLYRPVLRHGILRERLADLLTDAFRAQLLRIMGYRADVFEFVSPEHTAKNLLIRAQRGLPPGDPQAVAEYRALKGYWGLADVALERLLGPALQPYLEQTP